MNLNIDFYIPRGNKMLQRLYVCTYHGVCEFEFVKYAHAGLYFLLMP